MLSVVRVFYHTCVLGAEVYPEIPRKKSKDVPQGNGPVPYCDELGCGEPMMADLYRMLKKSFDRMDKNLDRPSHFDRQD